MKDVLQLEEKGKQEAVARKEAEQASMTVSEEEDAVESDMLLADVAVHSLTSETELNGRQGVCVDVEHISSGLMTSDGSCIYPKAENFGQSPKT